MARINKAPLIADVVVAVHRTNLVIQDPVVEKAARVAWDDIVEAGLSTAALGREVAASWHRNAPGADRIPPV